MTTKEQKIGLIGAGLMGHGIGKNLVEKGFPLTVMGHRNRAPVEDLVGRGGVEAKTVAELAGRSDIVILCVTGSTQVEDLFHREGGLLASARPGFTVVDTSTSEPSSSLKLAEALRARGGEFVDAPLGRTPAEAEAGRLNTIVGASPETLARLRPVLEAYCENIFHAGNTGSGHRLKLINNFIVMSTVAVISEGFVAAQKTGVDPETLYRLLSAGPLSSALLNNLIPKALAGEYDAMKFQIANALKDMRYYGNLAGNAGLVSLMGAGVQQVFTQAVALGFGEKFVPSLIEAQAKINGQAG